VDSWIVGQWTDKKYEGDKKENSAQEGGFVTTRKEGEVIGAGRRPVQVSFAVPCGAVLYCTVR
jgi:hypothetical protein